MKPSVIVTRRWPESVENRLEEHFEVSFNKSDAPLGREQFRQALHQYDAIFTTVTDKLDAAVFDGLQASDIRTRLIGNYGVGYSHIEVTHAKRLGLVVTNTPDVLSDCTADIAIMLALMTARRAGEGERELRAGRWQGWRPTHMVGEKVSGKTFGVLGFGRIGRATAQRARGFGMPILVHNRSPIDGQVLKQFEAEQVESVDDLARQSDFLSLHCPGGAENTHLVNAELLRLMKPTAFLINTARGEVVDELALIDALKSGQIAGAGLDVFDNEPAINPAFLDLPNAVLLPHLGSASSSTRDGMGLRVMENAIDFFNNKEPADRVV